MNLVDGKTSNDDLSALDMLAKREMNEMNDNRAQWFELKRLLTNSPNYYSIFKGLEMSPEPNQLAIHYLLGILLKMETLGSSPSEEHLKHVANCFELHNHSLSMEELDLCVRNIKMFQALKNSPELAINSSFLATYLAIIEQKPVNEVERQDIINHLDNTRLLELRYISGMCMDNIKFQFSFSYFPRQLLLKRHVSPEAIHLMVHMYRNRRAYSDTAKYFIFAASSSSSNQELARSLITEIVSCKELSFQQITFFIVHVFTEFERGMFAKECKELRSDIPLELLLKWRFFGAISNITERIEDLSQTDAEVLFEFISQANLFGQITAKLLERLIASEEFDYNIKLLKKANYFIDEFLFGDMSCETGFYYIDLISSTAIVLEMMKQLTTSNCHDFELTFDKAVIRLSTLQLEELFSYYCANFVVEADTRHRWLFISRFIFQLSRRLHKLKYSFMGLLFPDDAETFVEEAFENQDSSDVLKSAYAIQELDTFPISFVDYVRRCMYATENVSSRTSGPENTESSSAPLPKLPTVEFDDTNINSYIPCEVSPPSEFKACDDEYTISCCLYFLKSVAFKGVWTSELVSLYYIYALTVQIIPTVKYLVKYLPPPSQTVKELIRGSLLGSGFRMSRNSAVLRYICLNIFSKSELLSLYNITNQQLVHVCLEHVPFADIIQCIDGNYSKITTFSAAMGLFGPTKEKNFSVSESCEFINIMCGKVGNICKLIALKHIRIVGENRYLAIDYLVEELNSNPERWSDTQTRIIAAHALALEANVSEYRGIISLAENEAKIAFTSAIKTIWGIDLESLLDLTEHINDESA